MFTGGVNINSHEIAKLANVSRSTVSRVINNYSNVPEETRIKVQKVIDEYGYTPNNSARTLAGKTNNIIGVFLADINKIESDSKWVCMHSPYNMSLLSNIIQICKKKGYLTLVNTISDMEECVDMSVHLDNRMLHGIIFVGFPYHTKELEVMAKKGYNVVLIDQLSESDDESVKIKLVNTDNVKGGYDATKLLIDNGHKRLLHVAGDDRLSSLDREKGFRMAVEESELDECQVIYGMYREDIAYRETKKFLEKQIPTAIFAANDIMVLGVMKALSEKGLKVPEDVSIIGFDNLDWEEWTQLKLTTMNVSMHDIAEKCVELLFLDEPQHLKCEPTIVKRTSVSNR